MLELINSIHALNSNVYEVALSMQLRIHEQAQVLSIKRIQLLLKYIKILTFDLNFH